MVSDGGDAWKVMTHVLILDDFVDEKGSTGHVRSWSGMIRNGSDVMFNDVVRNG